jgi:hypothetical protein
MASSSSRLSKLNFIPGFHRESTQYSEEGKWFDGDRVRFREGRPENLRGYSKHTSNPIIGTSRALISWISNDTEKYLATGTEQRLNIFYNTNNYDVTPIITIVTLTSIMNVQSGSPIVSVNLNAHGVSIGDWIEFTSTSLPGFSEGTDFAVTAFGGPTYKVIGKSTSDHFSFAVNYNSDSTLTNVGIATANYLLPTQPTNSIQGLGYGAGVYNAGVSTTGERAWNEQAESSNITFLANQWSMDTWGEDLLAVRRGGKLFYWDADASISPERATVVSTSPTKINSIVVSPNDRHVIALGTNEFSTSIFNPLLIRWSDQENFTNWEPSISSTSGEIQLVDGTEIVGGIRSRNAIHIWTDRAMYALNFVGPPFIFNNTLLGNNAGLIGPHAAVALEGVTYWMGINDFFAFNGRVQKLDCTVRRHIYDSFNSTQGDKVYAGTNSEFHEVIWLYPSTNSLEPDRYIIYNTVENHWVFGTSFYTTFEDRVIFDNTITNGAVSVGGDNYYWDNEPSGVFTGDGEALASYLESADFDIEDGDQLMFIDRIIPDYTINSGNITFTIDTKQYPNGPTTTRGPFTINAGTQKVDMRARGRQASVRVSSTESGTSWRWGSVRMGIQPDGGR